MVDIVKIYTRFLRGWMVGDPVPADATQTVEFTTKNGRGWTATLIQGGGLPAGYFALTNKSGSLRLTNKNGTAPILGKAA